MGTAAALPLVVGLAGCQALVQFDPMDGGEPDEASAADGDERDDATMSDDEDRTDTALQVMPGASCITDLDCDAGQICDVRGCDLAAASVCVPLPAGCPDVWEPVCCCDGTTIANDCERLLAARRLRHFGECGVPAAPRCALDPDGYVGWSDFEPENEARPWSQYCWSNCVGCVAECRNDGEVTEGWYSSCGGAWLNGCLPDASIVLGDCG